MSESKAYSTRKLGVIGSIPVLPFLPLGAQVNAFGAVHYKMDDAGHYLNGRLPYFPLSKAKAILEAVNAQPKEDSYSDTGSRYRKLDVALDPAHPDRFIVKAGDTVIGYGLIDSSVEIVSSDESIDSQINGTAGDSDKDDDETDSDDGN